MINPQNQLNIEDKYQTNSYLDYTFTKYFLALQYILLTRNIPTKVSDIMLFI